MVRTRANEPSEKAAILEGLARHHLRCHGFAAKPPAATQVWPESPQGSDLDPSSRPSHTTLTLEKLQTAQPPTGQAKEGRAGLGGGPERSQLEVL